MKGTAKRNFLLLFWLAVLGSVFWQANELLVLQGQLSVCKEMQEECSVREAKSLLSEMECFPVRKDRAKKETCSFDNGYGGERTYGGNRKHEGIDIMPSCNKAGYFQVQSVSDGMVEQMGWLPLGGYRIGIRGKSGFYYYYAHLEAYAENLKIGKKVSSGEVLGTMGDTGYGKEGTRGKFAVHLHFGIYRQVNGKEKSLNPYYLLRYLS